MIRFVQGDVFEVDLPAKSAALVYADPPYANCRFNYARFKKSRQWGANMRFDFLRELIARMDSLRAADGVCAVSLSVSELKAINLFPSVHRVLAWVKTYAPNRPHVWPTYAWEPVICWGRFPNRAEQISVSQTTKDWLCCAPKIPEKGGHETPKPAEFAEWLLDATLGPRVGPVIELFAGTWPVAIAASKRKCPAVTVDIKQYVGEAPLLSTVEAA